MKRFSRVFCFFLSVLTFVACPRYGWTADSAKDLDKELAETLKTLDETTTTPPAAPAAEAPASAPTPAPSTPAAPAEEKKPVIIADVEVRGNNIVGTNTILNQVQSRKGEALVQETVNEDIKRLYATGYFEDIKIEVNETPNGYVLVVGVIEKPVIKKITIEGAQTFKEDKLRKELKVSEGQILDRKQVKQGVEAIRKLYSNKGFRFVDITSDVNVDRSNNETTVVIRINEGEKYKIETVTFEGVKSFKEKQLVKLMRTRAKNPWMFRSGVFKRELFEEDVERIQLFYQKEGYLDVQVAPDFSYDKPHQKITIKITVEEGPRYVAGDIKIQGNRLFPESEIWQEITMLPGQTFSQFYLSQDVDKIRDYYFSRGYMDARITPDTKLNKDNQKVDVVYAIEEGDLYFVDKVVVRGNTKTKDIVIRRELRIRPGDKFDGAKIDKSKERLENLGFFEDVTYDTEPSASAQNRKDLIFRVKEKRTGELSFGGGVSSVDNLVGFAELSQHNFDALNWPRFTGGGQSLSVRGRMGTINQQYNVSFVEPYLFNKPISWGLDAYKTHQSSENVDFEEGRLGAGTSFSRLFRDVYRLGTGYTLEQVKLDNISDDAPLTVRNVEGKNVLSRWKIFNTFDTRDSVFNPTKGILASLSGELVGSFLGGDQDFYILDTSITKYWSFLKKQGLETKLRLATSQEFGDSPEVPIFDRFYAGGLGTVRGYNYRRVGPIEAGNAVGGQTLLLGNVDYTFPLPRLDAFRGVAFVDYGMVSRDSYDFFTLGDGVISIGPGLKVKTPLGPVVLYYGFPLTNRDTKNKNGRFEFSLSRGF